jgi:hypothetical protein
MFEKKAFKMAFTHVLAALLVLGFCVTSSQALEGVAGEVITTYDELQDFHDRGLITPGQLILFGELVRNGITVPIVETTDRTNIQSDAYRELTEKYKGQCKIAPDDAIQNYKGGRPFPDLHLHPDDPQAAIKAAWNLEYKHTGDTFYTDWKYYLTDSKANIRILAGYWSNLYWTLRTDMQPIPNLDPNETEVRGKSVIHFRQPFASKGLSHMAIEYNDPYRDNDNYVYVPGLRRTTRVGGGNKCDCLGGFVNNMDDSDSFSGDVLEYTYKLIDIKDMLMVWQVDTPPPEYIVTHTEGMHVPNFKLERRKVWFVEATAKDKTYCYSKRTWYLDPETWWIMITEQYDRHGNLWKSQFLPCSVFKNPPAVGGGHAMINFCGTIVDLKIMEGGPFQILENWINRPLSPNTYTIDYLRRLGR